MATESDAPGDFNLVAMYRHVLEETNLFPSDIAPMLDAGNRPVTTGGGLAKAMGQRFNIQYWFFKYLGPCTAPWIIEPVFGLQHSYFSNPDTRSLYDDTPCSRWREVGSCRL